MKYKDQLVPMGRINDDYDALNDNVDDSYRRGVELSASWKVTGWFTASANATFSQNRIENYTELRTVYDNDEDWNVISDGPVALGTTKLAYSPDTTPTSFSTSTTADSKRLSTRSTSASSTSRTTRTTRCRSTPTA